MTRKLFLLATTLFWLAVLAIWAASQWPPASGQRERHRNSDENGTTAPAEKRFSLAELSRHARPDDCWMAIDGTLYELSAYLPEHPSLPEIILPWCGREATEAYRTKTKGQPHSSAADQLLDRYRIGLLEDGQ